MWTQTELRRCVKSRSGFPELPVPNKPYVVVVFRLYIYIYNQIEPDHKERKINIYIFFLFLSFSFLSDVKH